MVFNVNKADPCGVLFCLMTYFCLLYAYYVIIGVIIIPFMSESLAGCINGLILTLLLVTCTIAHLRASMSNPGYLVNDCTENSCQTIDSHEKSSKKTKGDQNMTLCSKCEMYRPAGTHHCKICRKCIKRRHHHCQWINNCIGELNQKYFVQFVFYIAVLCIYSIIFTIISLMMYPEDHILNTRLFNQSTRVYHSVFMIVECIIFGIFAFTIICEQFTSITSSQLDADIMHQLATLDNNNFNPGSHHSQPRLPATEEELKNLLKTYRFMIMYKYSQFRIVFGNKNPLYWVLPFDLEHYLRKIGECLLLCCRTGNSNTTASNIKTDYHV